MVARTAGCVVVSEPRRGYGSACLAGLAHLAALSRPPDVVVFLDADHSDHADELPRLLAPIAAGRADLVVGSRKLGRLEPGALLPQQRVGNWIATAMIRRLYGSDVTDLGPFRAITWAALTRLGMEDRDYGWTAEMQVKALKAGLRYEEVPVAYRRRVGRSKIAGTLRGTIGAGIKIVATILGTRRRVIPRWGRRGRPGAPPSDPSRVGLRGMTRGHHGCGGRSRPVGVRAPSPMGPLPRRRPAPTSRSSGLRSPRTSRLSPRRAAGLTAPCCRSGGGSPLAGRLSPRRRLS